MIQTEATGNRLVTEDHNCYTCHTCQTRRSTTNDSQSTCCGCEREGRPAPKLPLRPKLSLLRTRCNSRLSSCRSFSLLRLNFKGMTHSLLISLVIVSTFLCSLVNGEEEIKQTSTFTDSEKPSKLGELLQKLQAAKEALERERLLEQVSRDDANLYEYLRENLGSDAAELPIMPPRVKPYYAQPEAARDEPWSGQNKRGNYMTLCHFKICNMGRKRWKSWP